MKFISLLAALCLMSGCVALSPTDTQVIDAGNGNAQEWNNRIQAIDTPTPEQWSNSQKYSKLNAQSWQSLDNIAHQVKGN